MKPPQMCQREGCRKLVSGLRGDEFCSGYCCKVFHGVLPPPKGKRENQNRKRRIATIEKKVGGDSVVMENTDAMNRVISSGFETNRRNH